MPGPWNDGTDRQLLLSIIHLTAPQLPKWEQVAELMREGFTAESTRQHFQKLRRDCKAQFGEPKDAGSTSPAKKTLRKPKAAANGTTPAKSANKRKVKHDETADSVDDEDNIPSKKAKVEDGNEEDHDTPLL